MKHAGPAGFNKNLCGAFFWYIMAIMNKIVQVFLSRLTYGDSSYFEKDTSTNGVVEVLARVYERARNALEYRADHLVRRAAIERIIKRRIINKIKTFFMAGKEKDIKRSV